MKSCLRMLSIILTIALLIQMIPVTGAFAIEDTTEDVISNQAAEEEMFVDEPEEEIEIICENDEKRGETEKHFLCNDGSYLAVMYSDRVHYRPSNSDKWIEIDNTLVASGNDDAAIYSPKSSPVDVSFPAKISPDSKITYNVKGYNITWQYQSEIINSQVSNINAELIKNEDIQAAKIKNYSDKNNITVVKTLDSSLIYNEYFENADLKYSINPNGIKEDIILNSKSAQDTFTVTYNIGELKAVQKDSKTIQLLNNDEVIIELAAPCMYDAENVTSNALKYTIISQEDGILNVQLTADREWLDDEKRVYPVTIDPYFYEENTKNSNDATACYSNHSDYPYGSLTVGKNTSYNKCRSFIKFDLPTLNSGDMVIGGILALAQFGGSYGYSAGTDTMQLNIGNVTSDWNENAVRNTNNFSGLPTCSSTLIDYTTTSYSSNFTWRTFDISKSVKKWYNGGMANDGLYIWSNTESTNAVTIFAAANYGTHTYHPTLYISYLNNKGLEDRWTYHTQSAGESGTSYVNDCTGNLVFVAPITGTTGNICPASVSLVYNGYLSGEDMRKVYNGQGKSGLGWRFDFSQRIKAIVRGDPNNIMTKLYDAGFRYIYADSDGTEHYFTQIGTTNKYQDEEGLKLTLEVLSSPNSASEKYILSFDSGEKISFQSGGIVRRIYNTENKYVEYTYNSTNLIRITDGGNRRILLTYDSSNRVTQIADPSGRNTSFTYNSAGLLTQITYPDSKTTRFTYTSNKLSTVTCKDGYILQYGYSASGHDDSEWSKVTSITETGNDGTTKGKRLDIAYTYNNSTTFKYYPHVILMEDEEPKATETYQFDNVGRTVCIVDADGGASKYQYTSSTLSNNTANKLLSSGSFEKHVDNMLTNHSFENGTTGWTIYGDASGSIVAEKPYLGTKSLKLSSSVTANVTAYQRMALTPGVYTYSVYIKTDSATTSTRIYANCLNGWTSIGSYSSQTVNEKIDDYRRLSVTFTAPSGTNYVNIAILNSGIGTAWIDCAQLEEGAVVNDYNMLENSGFENSSSTAWTTSGLLSTDGVYYDPDDNEIEKNHFRISGNTTTTPNIHQVVQVNRPAGETFFSVSGNAKADSVPIRDTRYFAIDIRTTFTDGTFVYNVVKFNPDVTGWQHTSEVIGYTGANALKTISSITFWVIYYRNANQSSYDSFSLNIDRTGTTYTYDSDGNLVSAKDNAGRNQVYTYSNANEVTKAITADNKAYNYKYDTSNPHRLLSATSASSNIQFAYTYDSNGNVTSSKVLAVNSNGSQDTSQKYIQTETTYTSDGNYVATQKDARGKVTSYNYNTTKGTLTSVTDPKGNTTSYNYNANNDNLTSVTSGDSTVSYTYDSSTGYLSGINGNNVSYSFVYDEFGNTTQTKVGSQTLMTNIYESDNGNLITSKYGNDNNSNSNTVSYVYDDLDRVIQKNYNGVEKYYWNYNAKGLVGSHIDNENGKTYNYDYDLLGRIQRVNVSDGSFIESSYNNIDLSTGLKYGFGGTTKSVGYTYSTKDNMPDAVTLPNNTNITNVYDKIGRVTSVNYGNVFSYDYTYIDNDSDSTTPLVSSVRSVPDAPMYLYIYDDNGNIEAFGYANYDGTGSSLRASYQYDSLNQLVRSNSLTENATWVYDYDNGGNILSKTKYAYTTGSLTGLTPVETINYTYGNSNWHDLLTAYDGNTITHDAIGNPLTYNGWTYTWQNGRQLAGLTDGTDTLSYKYNADGIRTSKTVNGTTTEYFLNGSTILAQKTGNDIMWFYYDHSGKRVAIEYNGNLYYYIYNLQGDVMYIADSNGYIVGGYQYDSWGKVINAFNAGPNTVATANPFRYRGYYYDSETGFYLTGTRYYDPEIGRFISPDTTDVITATPMALTDKNLYAYCDNNPVVRADHSGEFWNYVIGGVVGAVVGGVSAAISGGDWKAIALGAGVGAVGGLLAASGVPAGFQIVAGGLLSGGNNLATQTLVEGKSLQEVDWIDVGIDTAIGAGTSALSYGVTRNASKAADKIICKGANKVVKGQQSLLSGSRYGKGAIKKGTAIMNSGIKQMNTVRGTSSVVGSTSGGFLTSVKSFFKRLFR